MVFHMIELLGWVDLDLWSFNIFPPVQPFLPISHQSKQNITEGGTATIVNNPTPKIWQDGSPCILDSLVKQFPDPGGPCEGERPDDARIAHGLPDGRGVGVAAGDHVDDALKEWMVNVLD